ncbi:TIGR02996 domain-containing protein [Frigoriglobus tundricola]|uniref:TIGR02996 domain-containing protein n=1 Tax=Frigoriglobus tundricola TaxID=2774151 RepID=A0A6M5YS49_9BACT|nr:TIGR02996 domain-containing protein [Frigoriglobus tundricola]QJW96875.1 hypothetical protein FTUN_4435 [Frigoriglobus tundricola]
MTDPDADALLRAIVRHPDEDTPRLAYADWLQENGRPEEAEFLRVQCWLAAAEPGEPEYPELVDRDEELRLWLTTHVAGPRPTFPGGLSVEGGSHWWWLSHRGFPRFLHYAGIERPGAKAMRTLGAAVGRAFEALPTRWLVVNYVTVAQLAALLKQPVLAGLSHLTLHLTDSGEGADEAARLLAKCRHLRNLRGLSLAFGVGDAACAALAAAPWEGLEWFKADCHPIGPAGIRALAGAGWFRRLRELILPNGLPDETFDELVRLPPLTRLHTLDLSMNSFPEASWQGFARTRTFPALARLWLRDGDMSGGRLEALAGAGGFELRILDLSGTGCHIDRSGTIAAASWAKSLRVLDLSLNALGPAGVKAIAANQKFRALRHLSLADNALGPTGLTALVGNPALRKLRALDIGGAPHDNRGLSPAHFERFLTRLDMPDLRHLDLSGRPVGSKAARRLTDPRFGSLTRLCLKGCRLTDAAVSALVTAPALANLIQLELSDNRLTTGPERLTDRSVLPRLASCTLSGNPLPPAVTRKLRRRPGVRV